MHDAHGYQETMFSGSYLYQVSGDAKYADRVERITYNALPATLTGGKSLLVSQFLHFLTYNADRHVVETVSAAAESDRGAKHDAVRVDVYSRGMLAQSIHSNPFPLDGPYSNVL